MAELKNLNGYEIVDQAARDTKQNKVLYGSSDPSNTVGNDGDVYISTTEADVINDLQQQITDTKNYINRFVPVMGYHDSGNTLTVTATPGTLLVIKGSGNNSYYFGIITMDNWLLKIVSDDTYDSNLSYSREDKVITFPTNGWYTYHLFR